MFLRESARYDDRNHAGRVLADLVRVLDLAEPLIVGIPRGGVIVAAEVARIVGGSLDVLVVRKIGAPRNPELAIGAVTASGQLHLDRALIEHLAIPETVLTSLIVQQQRLAENRASQYAAIQPWITLTGRNVVLVDDGLATGTTMSLAAQLVREGSPIRIVVAVPVGSRQAVDLLASQVDQVVCPVIPDEFHAVGQYYRDFDEVSDADVARVLSAVAAERKA